jgi:hypothetical protein
MSEKERRLSKSQNNQKEKKCIKIVPFAQRLEEQEDEHETPDTGN